MTKINQNIRNLRSALFLGAASAAIGMASQSAAQESGGNNVETVVVTGSRIPQTGVYSASPVTAVGQQELKFEGTTDVTTLINNLPEAFVDQNQGVANGATGTANVDLRGLGSKRTLVLINGTRLMPGDIVAPVPDLNDIPAALVDHVEVLTGGASAVYGSDALAGVVNFILRKDFQGVEVDGTYSVAQNDNDNSRWRGLTQAEINAGAYGFAQSKENIWDGQTVDATLLMGTNTANDKGNVTAYLGYRSTQPVLEASRDYSECTMATANLTGSATTNPHYGSTTVGPYTNTVCNGSSNYSRFLSLDNAYAGLPDDFFVQGKNPNGNFVPYQGLPDQHFNYGSLNYFQRPDTRYTGGFFAHYQESKELDLYSSLMFADDHTIAQIAQSGFFLASGQGPSGTVYTNCGNPYMTAKENLALCGDLPGDMQQTVLLPNGQKFTYWNGAGNGPGNGNAYGIPGQANLWIGRRDIEGPDRQADIRHSSYRMQAGARGDLGDGWTYDVYAQYGLTLINQTYTGEFSKTRTQNAIEVDPATGQCYSAETTYSNNGIAIPPTSPGCVPINIFTGLGSISPQALKYVLAQGFQEGWTQEQIVSGSLTGDLGQYGIQSPWAKNAVGISVGTEYRDEELKLDTDYEYQTNDLYGQGAATLPVPESGYNVTEGFTEVKVPLVQAMPWVEDLSLNAGYRYSSYNRAGPTNTYKYGAEWQPIDDFRLRASVQRAVRAPNVVELFSPLNVILFSGQDPCLNATGTVYNNCVHNKYSPVPANAIATSLVYCPATQCNSQVGGNSALRPEVSDTRTAGIVFTPTFLDGFTATFDWFDIKVDNFINSLPAQEILNECYSATATAASMAYFCPLVHRNGAGVVYGTGYVADATLNTGYLTTKGVDFEFNYQTDLSSWGLNDGGSVSFNLVGTYLTDLTAEPVPQSPLLRSVEQPFNCAGLYGLTCSTVSGTGSGPNPKWRQKLRVTWTSPWDVDLSLQWRYIGATSLDADTSNPLIGGSSTPFVCPSGKTVYGAGSATGATCPDAQIASYDYFDLSGDWTVREGVDLRAGVNNIFDIEPPVLGTLNLPLPAGNGNTYAGMYDSLGRTIFVAATIKY